MASGQEAVVVEKEYEDEQRICKRCGHNIAEHRRVFSIKEIKYDYAECHHKIVYKDMEYYCGCKKFEV